jgi:hypothetical protein
MPGQLPGLRWPTSLYYYEAVRVKQESVWANRRPMEIHVDFAQAANGELAPPLPYAME